MTVILLVGVFMFLRDCVATANVVFIGEDKKLLAGVADGVGDIMSMFSVGIGGYTAATHGLSLLTLGVALSLGIASIAGTAVGMILSKKVGIKVKKGDVALEPVPACE